MDSKLLKSYEPVINQYPIDPRYIQDFGKVKKVFTSNGIYALKEIDQKEVHSLWGTLSYVYQKGYQGVLPLFYSKRQELFVQHGDQAFYMVPWMNIEGDHRYKDIFKEAARVHSYTTEEKKVTEEQISDEYKRLIERFEKRQKYFEEQMDLSEKSVYMSPFELLYGTIFTQMMIIHESSKSKIEEWYKHAKEAKMYRVVCCHGNLSPEHVVYEADKKPYLISFEHAFIGSPVYDVQSLLENLMYDNLYESPSHVVELYSVYLNHFSITAVEISLLETRLLGAEGVYEIVKGYREGAYDSEIEAVRMLQREFLKLRQSSMFVSILEEERKAKEDE